MTIPFDISSLCYSLCLLQQEQFQFLIYFDHLLQTRWYPSLIWIQLQAINAPSVLVQDVDKPGTNNQNSMAADEQPAEPKNYIPKKHMRGLQF
jgi:hypothetical protein